MMTVKTTTGPHQPKEFDELTQSDMNESDPYLATINLDSIDKKKQLRQALSNHSSAIKYASLSRQTTPLKKVYHKRQNQVLYEANYYNNSNPQTAAKNGSNTAAENSFLGVLE